MDSNVIRTALAGLPVSELLYFPSTGSTNDEALRWSGSGAKDGSLVIADTQTAGRGRMDRRWITNPGAALAFSLIFRPSPAEMAHLGLFSPLGALATADALTGRYGLQAEVKWPNDVLLNRRKVCGILVEVVWLGNTAKSVVVGIGVNVAPQAVPPDDQVIYPAISVEQALGRPVDRLELLREVLEKIFAWRSLLNSQAFFQAWEGLLAFKGEWVEVLQPGSPPVTGTVAGIAPSGDLRLATATGETIHVAAGDVRLRPAGDENTSKTLGG